MLTDFQKLFTLGLSSDCVMNGSLHCALASCGSVYCNRSCLWVCDSGRAVSEPYYMQPARAQCLRLSERFLGSTP